MEKQTDGVREVDLEIARPHHDLQASERELAAAREEHAHLMAVVDSMDCHVCVLDACGRILWVNESWRRFAVENGGRPEACCEGSDCFALHGSSAAPADTSREFLTRLREVLDGRSDQFEVEYSCHSPDQPRWFRARVHGYQSPGQRRAVVSHQDITASKLAEAERTAMVRQHHELQKLEVIGAMASGIAHDFNNILTAIVGNLDLARMQAANDTTMSELLGEIGKASDRARRLVKQILAFRPQRAQQRQCLPLAPLIEEAAGMLRAGVGRDLHVEMHLAPVPPLPIEPTQIHQVLLNLFTNASHAMDCKPAPGRSHKLSIELTTVELPASSASRPPGTDPGRHARIRVGDTGTGIAAELVPRIFDPYFTTKPIGTGNGIGLTIANAIVRDHGGVIDVHSEIDVGTTFDVYLPYERHPSTPTALPHTG